MSHKIIFSVCLVILAGAGFGCSRTEVQPAPTRSVQIERPAPLPDSGITTRGIPDTTDDSALDAAVGTDESDGEAPVIRDKSFSIVGNEGSQDER